MRADQPAIALDYEAVARLTTQGVLAPPDPRAREALDQIDRERSARRPTFGERLAARVRDDQARANVAKGSVHPQLYDFARYARAGFTPDHALIKNDPRSPNSAGGAVRSWGRGVVEAYRQSLRGGDEASERRRTDRDRDGAPDLFDSYNRILRGNELAATPIACLVCVELRPGLPPAVKLVGSSGNSGIDREATQALDHAVRRKAVDTDLRPGRACYRFTATMHRLPPLPIVGCGFDEASLKAECYYPTKAVYRTTVNLESVDHGG
jgi:hypothetical protein